MASPQNHHQSGVAFRDQLVRQVERPVQGSGDGQCEVALASALPSPSNVEYSNLRTLQERPDGDGYVPLL